MPAAAASPKPPPPAAAAPPLLTDPPTVASFHGLRVNDALVLPHGAVVTVAGVRRDGPGGAPRLWGVSDGGGGGGGVEVAVGQARRSC